MARTAAPHAPVELLEPTMTRPTKSRPSPIDLRYAHGQELPNGAHFAVLKTPLALKRHWASIGHSMPFAAHGNCPGDRPRYLHPNEWIFAPTRPALVEAALRWTTIGIKPVWYDWRTQNPEEYAYFFRERERFRQHRILHGNWTPADEEGYLAQVRRKNPENFRGWWRLTNLPYNHTHETWFSGLLDEPFDPPD